MTESRRQSRPGQPGRDCRTLAVLAMRTNSNQSAGRFVQVPARDSLRHCLSRLGVLIRGNPWGAPGATTLRSDPVPIVGNQGNGMGHGAGLSDYFSPGVDSTDLRRRVAACDELFLAFQHATPGPSGPSGGGIRPAIRRLAHRRLDPGCSWLCASAVDQPWLCRCCDQPWSASLHMGTVTPPVPEPLAG